MPDGGWRPAEDSPKTSGLDMTNDKRFQLIEGDQDNWLTSAVYDHPFDPQRFKNLLRCLQPAANANLRLLEPGAGRDAERDDELPG